MTDNLKMCNVQLARDSTLLAEFATLFPTSAPRVVLCKGKVFTLYTTDYKDTVPTYRYLETEAASITGVTLNANLAEVVKMV